MNKNDQAILDRLRTLLRHHHAAAFEQGQREADMVAAGFRATEADRDIEDLFKGLLNQKAKR